MSHKDCCSKESTPSTNVTVDVAKIVKYNCIAGVLIVAIIFATKCFLRMLEEGFFELADE